MKLLLRKASDYNFKEEVEVSTLEELIDLDKKHGTHGFVITFDPPMAYIYDDYLE